MQVDIPELKDITTRLGKIERRLAVREKETREWYNLKDACVRKGINYNTAKSITRYQPNHGIPEARLCGRKVWRRRTIERWLRETDGEERP